ncbi:inner centromere protein-like [Oppia nitens]|uniref:inner centromere protein-like n=1 Tax=Oppia nitens TaxID=1686743 RepID=UPI0023DACA25|nr:inner centromere protein-like [Oppia nitens]
MGKNVDSVNFGAYLKTLFTNNEVQRRQEYKNFIQQKLLSSEEKIKRAEELRTQLLERKVTETKAKNIERREKAAKRRLLIEREKRRTDRLLEKQKTLREISLIKNRRELMAKKQEETIRKANELERRKQLFVLKEAVKSFTKLVAEDQRRQQRQRYREWATISANLIINKKTKSEKEFPIIINTNDGQVFSHNNNSNNYNITDLRSDQEADDEDCPRNRVPKWAIGHTFMQSVYLQFNKPLNKMNDEIYIIFGSINKLSISFVANISSNDLFADKQQLSNKDLSLIISN